MNMLTAIRVVINILDDAIKHDDIDEVKGAQKILMNIHEINSPRRKSLEK